MIQRQKLRLRGNFKPPAQCVGGDMEENGRNLTGEKIEIFLFFEIRFDLRFFLYDFEKYCQY